MIGKEETDRKPARKAASLLSATTRTRSSQREGSFPSEPAQTASQPLNEIIIEIIAMKADTAVYKNRHTTLLAKPVVVDTRFGEWFGVSESKFPPNRYGKYET